MTLQVSHSTSQKQRTQMRTVSEQATRLVSWTHERLVLALSRSWQARLSNWAHVAQCGSPSQADRASQQEQALITTLQPGLPPQCTVNCFLVFQENYVPLEPEACTSQLFWYFVTATQPFWATLMAKFDHTAFARFSSWGIWAVQKVQEADFLWPLSRALCFQTLVCLGPPPRWQAAVNQKQATTLLPTSFQLLEYQ